MKQRVSKSTRRGYEISNTPFILWMFDHHKKYPSRLQPTLYNMKKTKNLKDISHITTRGKWSKSRHVIRSFCREFLWKIKPYVQASIPVKLEHLTFAILSRFLITFKKKLKKGYTRARKRWQTGCWSLVTRIHVQGCMFSPITFISWLRE